MYIDSVCSVGTKIDMKLLKYLSKSVKTSAATCPLEVTSGHFERVPALGRETRPDWRHTVLLVNKSAVYSPTISVLSSLDTKLLLFM